MAGTERELTAWLRGFFARNARGIDVPIGDDAAVVASPGRSMVVCCDPVVAGVHFDDRAPLAWVGRKAVNRNLSDLAAMGARPDYLLVSLLLPATVSRQQRTALLRGVRSAADRFGARVIGGDVGRTPGPLTVTVTAIGGVTDRILRRNGARSGDRVFASGSFGGSLLGRHLRFEPAVELGQWLARSRASFEVGGVIDVSDGLLLDLWTMLQASGPGLGVELDTAKIPIHPAARRLARRGVGGAREAGPVGARALHHALHDGEDYVLLFTARGRVPAGGPWPASAREPFGRIVDDPGIWLVGPDGSRESVAPGGYEGLP